jgi:hypothetical protein
LGTWESTNPNVPSTTPLLVLAADTTVTLDNHILGKPSDPSSLQPPPKSPPKPPPSPSSPSQTKA